MEAHFVRDTHLALHILMPQHGIVLPLLAIRRGRDREGPGIMKKVSMQALCLHDPHMGMSRPRS
jgi:hypothetical protein